MSRSMVLALSSCLVMTAGAAILAAPGQDRPGQSTQARVWIENRGRHEAVPVVLEEVTRPMPIKVETAIALTGDFPRALGVFS
jgi:hypothetical protein